METASSITALGTNAPRETWAQASGPIHLGRRTAEGGCPHMSCGAAANGGELPASSLT